MNKKALFVSSLPPLFSAGFGYNVINKLKKAGYDVTFLTLYKFGKEPCETLYVHNYYRYLGTKSVDNFFNRLIEAFPFLGFTRRVFDYFYLPSYRVTYNGVSVVCRNEAQPPVPIDKIIKLIKGRHFDLITTGFWENMLTSATLEALYNELKCKIIIAPVDFYSITGGCYCLNNCPNHLNECKNCSVYGSIGLYSQAHENFTYKKKVYEKINAAFMLNSHVKKMALDSGIIKSERIFFTSFCLDEKIFKPQDEQEARNYFGIPEGKTFIILGLYVPDQPRKGTKYMKEAIRKFTAALEEKEKRNILLLLLGKPVEKNVFEIDTISTGQLKREELIKAYSVSSVYISASTDDAGPSMVNQCIACGTPVVAFNIGTAIDVIKSGLSGYTSELYDVENLANNINLIHKMSVTERVALKKTTREIALQLNSIKAGLEYLNNAIINY